MKQPSLVVKALASLCLLAVDGSLVTDDGAPDIVGPDRVQIRARLGQPLVLHCDAFTNGDDGVTLIYWLINGSFPEEMSSSGRIVESNESTLKESVVLQRSLLLKNVTTEDLESAFTCVVTNAVGVARKHVRLTTKSHERRRRTQRKMFILG